MEALNQWVTNNPGAVVILFLTCFGILVTVLIHRSNHALTAKDATIELLRTQNEALTRDKSTYEAKQQTADDNNKLNNETIAYLHKRISELEANQFFEFVDGSVRLKSHVCVPEDKL